MLSVSAFVGFPVTFAMGWCVERVGVHRVLGITYIFQVLVVLLLTSVTSLGYAIGCAVVWGVASGCEIIAFSVVFPDYFGKTHIGAISGASFASLVLGSAVGPVLYGGLFDSSGSFTLPLLVTVPWAVMCFAASLLARPPPPLAYTSAQQDNEELTEEVP